MKIRYLTRSILIIFSLLFSITGCSSTKLISSWSEPDFREKPLKKILIAGVIRNDLHRRLYEDNFVKYLSRQGVAGIQAYSVIPDSHNSYSEEQIHQAVKESGADAALIANVVEVKKEERYVPPTYEYTPSFGYRRGLYDYYGMSYRAMYTPGYTTTDTTIKLETTVFSTSTGKMIWAGSTKSFNPSSAESVINKNAELIISDMKKADLL